MGGRPRRAALQRQRRARLALNPEYGALVAKVDAFFSRVAGRYSDQLACRSGCDGCCQFHLTVSPVEAAEMRAGLAAMPLRARKTLAARAKKLGSTAGPCPALDADGRCGIYAFRPLVCRTHGLPMRVPGDARLPVLGDGLGEEQSDDAGGLSVCPLNFTATPLTNVDADCVLDLSTLDATLALVNARADPNGQRLERISIGDVLLDAHRP